MKLNLFKHNATLYLKTSSDDVYTISRDESRLYAVHENLIKEEKFGKFIFSVSD